MLLKVGKPENSALLLSKIVSLNALLPASIAVPAQDNAPNQVNVPAAQNKLHPSRCGEHLGDIRLGVALAVDAIALGNDCSHGWAQPPEHNNFDHVVRVQ